MSTPRKTTPEAALPAPVEEALSRGLSIIPTDLNKKAMVSWKTYQTAPAPREQLLEWQRDKKPHGWAIVTGQRSGVLVLDFDGEAGVRTLKRLGLQAQVRTGSGGLHVYVRHPGEKVRTVSAKTDQKLGSQFPGLDVRGDGGYAVFHGENARGRYELLGSLEPLPFEAIPAPVRELLKARQAEPITNGNGHRPSAPAQSDTHASRDVLIRKAIERARAVGRNNAGFGLATQARDNGFSEAEAISMMDEYRRSTSDKNAKGQAEPYTADEAGKSVESAYSRKPRPGWSKSAPRQTRQAKQPAPAATPPELPTEPDAPAPIDVPEAELPRGYRMDDSGLWKEEDKGDIYLSAPFKVLSLTRNESNQDWGKEIQFKDYDGREHTLILSQAHLTSEKGEWHSQLAESGLQVNPDSRARRYLRQFLSQMTPTTRTRKIDVIGWHNRQTIFITPAWTIPHEAPERILLDQRKEEGHFFHQSGTLDQWQEHVAAPSAGNPLLVFGLAAAFAPILLPLRQGMGGGFHFASGSSTGKSTTLRVAGSVWGGGGKNGFCRSWNLSAVGAEAIAQAHNHSLLCLDELKELGHPEEAGRLAYFFAHGYAKGRGNIHLKLRRSLQFDLVFLSTGEFGFLELIERTSGRVFGGQEVRIVEIPADCGRHGSFDDLHKVASPAAFAQILSEGATTYFGTAAPAFITKFLKVGVDQVREDLGRLMEEFTRLHTPKAAAPEVARVIERFAFVAAAGVLAARWDVLPFDPREVVTQTAVCLRNWLRVRGTVGSRDQKAALDHLREYLNKWRYARFLRHVSGSPINEGQKYGQVDGYINEKDPEDREIQFDKQWRREVLGSYSQDLMIRALDEIGALQRDGKHRQVRRSIPDRGWVRMWVVSEKLLMMEPDDLPQGVFSGGKSGK